MPLEFINQCVKGQLSKYCEEDNKKTHLKRGGLVFSCCFKVLIWIMWLKLVPHDSNRDDLRVIWTGKLFYFIFFPYFGPVYSLAYPANFNQEMNKWVHLHEKMCNYHSNSIFFHGFKLEMVTSKAIFSHFLSFCGDNISTLIAPTDSKLASPEFNNNF